jgi:hypothetical protein
MSYQNHFETIDDFLDYIRDTPESNYSRSFNKNDFCRYSFDETMDAVAHGWPEGSKDILDLSEQINAILAEDEKTWTIQYDVQGEYIDMGRYVTGEPECCGTVIREVILRPMVNIAFNVSACGNTPTENLKRRGAVVLSLIDQLRRDHIVKVHIYNYVHNMWAGKPSLITMGVATANEYSRDLLATCMGHPGFLRRLIFAANERQAGERELNGYGVCAYDYVLPEDEGAWLQFRCIQASSSYGSLGAAVNEVVTMLKAVQKKQEKT